MSTRTLLTIESFAEKLGISRSTAYSWLADGKLVVGRHVVRIGRVVRVVWDDDLLAHLLAISVDEAEELRPQCKRNGKGGRNRLAIDPNLLESL
ncbi:helix-turn-helix transcriptional regulator [Geobacter pickeringii]|uniref:Helix-turn-helix domain-containing protein n=1 Tax=Geobacter pickeringii TaxID=345632 RepID=A0A0B5BAC6_9BACT|nr:helix-turn-helix domain-containing protein [Geobacter pickeringii]AJE03658.1 hypothetical protein GPICK_10120 [Geobacter pickeringii]